MSGLQDINLPTTNIKVPHNPNGFDVRGLSLPDILNIVHEYRDDATKLFEQFSSEESVGADILHQIIALAPDMVGLLINLAADGTPSTLTQALKLPVSVQLNALEAIANLTFEAEGGPKKLVETVVRMMGGFNGVSEAVQDSMISSAVSQNK